MIVNDRTMNLEYLSLLTVITVSGFVQLQSHHSFSLSLLFSVLTGQQYTSSDSQQYDGRLYPSHIPTSSVQKAILAVGSGVAALMNPYRHGEAVITLHDVNL